MSDTDMTVPPAVPRPTGFRGMARRVRTGGVRRLHALADKLDRIPSEFGKSGPVDESDPLALEREWLRCLRRWADDNPEQLFAIKVGGGLLVLAVVVLWFMVGMIR